MSEKRYFYITPDDYETARKNGIQRATVYARVNTLGWDVDKAITTPVKRIKDGNLWRDWKDEAVVCRVTFYTRCSRGMSPEQAALTPKRKHGSYKKEEKYA